MANVEAGLKELEKLNYEYQDAINHDETILVSSMFVFIRRVLEAMREPSNPVPVDDRAITRGQADAINRRQTELFKQINDIQSIISGTKRKWRDEVDRRLNVLESGNITKDNNGDLIRTTIGNTAGPASIGSVNPCNCGAWINHETDHIVGCAFLDKPKKTIEIDREIIESYVLHKIGSFNALNKEIKRALAK